MVVEITLYNLNVKGSMKHVIVLFWNLNEVKVLQEVANNKKGKDWVNWFKEADMRTKKYFEIWDA